jgi:hypothetical protein
MPRASQSIAFANFGDVGDRHPRWNRWDFGWNQTCSTRLVAFAFDWRIGSWIVLTQLVACAEPPVADELVHSQVLTVQLPMPDGPKRIDILFVIDDSASMAEEQAHLAANFHAFIDVLEDPEVEADYRIAVTTTDSGNPRCDDARAERGALVLEPCTRRLDDFVRGDIDVRDTACKDICTLTDAQLEILATTTDHDSTAQPRPWLENIGGKTNVPDGVDVADAFACLGPQGIGGCDFQAPLESMHLALDRMLDVGDPAYGFLRKDAFTMIVFVTDGHDCSHAEADIFSPGATEAVCWDAGVECFGDPSGYDACEPVGAALHPIERYVERLQAREDGVRELVPNYEAVVAVVAGVGPDGDMHLAEADDPEFQEAHGIGPGCIAQGGISALPPVRLAEFAEAFTPDNVFSICNPDYTPALQAIAEKIRDQIRPACFTGCVVDSDRSTEVIEPDCFVEQRVPGREGERMTECERDSDGSYVIDLDTMDYTMPPGENACYAMLVDPGGQTIDFADDTSPECEDFDYNLEFKISRRPGFPAPGGTAIFATCVVSNQPQIDCPNLGTRD